MRLPFPHKRVVAGVLTIGAALLGSLTLISTAQADSADPSTSIVEDFTYPGAAQLLAEQNVRLISGDGNIVLVDCTTPAEGDIGLLKVYTTDEAIGADGVGRLCFKLRRSHGFLNLEVPGVYELHGDGLKSGTGHDVTADLKTDDGDQISVDVDPDGSTQVGLGVDPDNAPTMLLRLEVAG